MDPKAKLVRFPTAKNQKTRLWIHHHSPQSFLPKDKRVVGNYIFNHWLQSNGTPPRSKARLLIWHEVDAHVITDSFAEEIDWDQCCEETDKAEFIITASPIQAASLTRTGWLYASTFYTNCDNLRIDLMNTKTMKANPHIQLDCRWSAVQRAPKERPPTDPNERCFGVHVLCSTDYHSEASALLSSIYKETNKSGQPQSKKFHFIPDLSAPECDCRSNEQNREMYDACMDEQRIFQSSIRTIELRNVIKDASRPLGDHNSCTLYDMISAIRDPDNPNVPLFLGLDQDKDNPTVWHITIRTTQFSTVPDGGIVFILVEA